MINSAVEFRVVPTDRDVARFGYGVVVEFERGANATAAARFLRACATRPPVLSVHIVGSPVNVRSEEGSGPEIVAVLLHVAADYLEQNGLPDRPETIVALDAGLPGAGWQAEAAW
jgi:hypothetical protein